MEIELHINEKFKNKQIIVMDDQGSMRGVFQAFLKDLGFTSVHCVVDGSEGLKYMEAHSVDMVICDWNMPKMNGLEVLQAIRNCEDTKTLPFLMVTSSSELARVKEAASHGVSDYLIKPFQSLQLGQKVIQLISESTHKPQTLKQDSAPEDLTYIDLSDEDSYVPDKQ